MMNRARNAYRLTWNPNRTDDISDEDRKKVEKYGKVDRFWRCGRARIHPGCRIYLVRLGKEPKGLIGVGRALADPSDDDDPVVKIEFKSLGPEPLIDLTELKNRTPYKKVAWANQRQAIVVPPDVADKIDDRLAIRGIGSSNVPRRGFPRREAQALQDGLESYNPENESDARNRITASIVNRRGQRRFRRNLLSAYGKRCAISRCDVCEVLEAAHIIPYNGRRTNSLKNGLLLRADLHTLFDLHLLCIDPDDKHRIHVAPSLLHSKSSGYDFFHGTAMALPRSKDEAPAADALRWHRSQCAWYQPGH